MKKKQYANQKVWVGLDWGDEKHAIAVVTESCEKVAQFTVANTPQGYAKLHERLSAYGEVLGVSIEDTRNMVIEYLKQHSYIIYLINPKMSKAWRETDTISGAKSDARDGLCLARGLAFRHKQLTVHEAGETLQEKFALLCELEAAQVQFRTSFVQKLQSVLKQYYPMALEFIESWSAPTAWDFLLRFPTPGQFTRAHEKTVINFLKEHRLGISERWKARLEARRRGNQWPVHPMEEVYSLRAQSIARTLQQIDQELKNFRKEIAVLRPEIPELKLIRSLPGAGEVLTPRLMSIVGSKVAQQGGLEALRGHTGVAPVTIASGKQEQVRIRFMCNKYWRNTLHIFAWCSVRFCPWANAFYHYRRQKGDSHSTTLRKLADKWLKIIMKILETKEAYNEEKYVQSLKRNGSPTWEYMKLHPACG